jgi:DNA-binding XRE family transcriptional regulator
MKTQRKLKGINANDWIASLPAEQRAEIEARTKVLIAEELVLQDLRKAMALTQTQLAATLGVGQEHVSRIEKRSDMLLSTLKSYVAAMGGELKLVAQFPNRPDVIIAELADLGDGDDDDKPAAPRRKRSGVAKKVPETAGS